MAELPMQSENDAVPAQYRDPEPFTVDAQGQELTFYPAGGDRFDALIEIIDGAQSKLRMCFYIFAEDESGSQVRDALVRAARRGVDTQLIIDGFGASVPDAFFHEFREAGGQYWRFSAKPSRRYLIRNHQKMTIVDDDRAMIGGFNVEQDYFASPEKNGWHDMGVAVRGDAVEQLAEWFDQLEDWVARPGAQFRDIRAKVKNWRPKEGPVSLLIGGPTRGLSSWALRIKNDLKKGDRLDMVMAYFSPNPALVKRIGDIAGKGNTRLIMAGKSDNGATIGATRSLYSKLLDAGADIYEFSPCKLHMKLVVLDDAVYIGSANFDMRSLYLNLELMLRIEDQALADRLHEFVGTHLPASERITPAEHKRRATWLNRLRWKASWLLVGVLDYTVSRRLNLGL